MRKLYSTLILFFSAITTMAQGWPENYNGVMLQGFYCIFAAELYNNQENYSVCENFTPH